MAAEQHFAILYRRHLLSPSLEEFGPAALDFLAAFRGQRCDGEEGSGDFRFLEAQHSAVAYVLIRAADDSSLRKEVGLRHAAPLITYLTANYSKLALSSIQCLQVLQYYYPSACGSVSPRIENYAISHFSSESADMRCNAACLYVLAASLSNKKGLPWSDRFRMLLRSSHEIVCNVSGLVHVDKNCTLKSSFLSLECVVDIQNLSSGELLNVYRSVLCCLVEMTKIGTGQGVEIPVLELIGCFECMSLMIATKLRPEAGDRLELQEALALLFNVMNSVIAAAKCLFAPFCPRICRAFLKLLKGVPKGYGSSAATIRSLIYDGLTSVFTYVGAASKLHLNFQDVLRVLQEEMSICALWFQCEPETHKLHGQRQHIYLSLHANVEQHVSVQKFLSTLEAIIANVGSLLPSESYQMLQLFVLRLLPRCETITEDHDFVVRSVARKLRASLCGVLNTFLLNPHPKAPYYLNVAIDLLRRGSVDKGDILTGLSKHGLSICDRITKPMVPFSHSLTCAEVERNPDGTATDVEILSGHLKESFNFGKAGSIIQRHDERRRSPINDVVVTKRQRVNSDEPQVTSSISTELTQLSSPKMDSCFRTLTDLQRDDSDSFNCIDESQSDHIPANENGCDASSDSGSSLDFEVNLVPKNSH